MAITWTRNNAWISSKESWCLFWKFHIYLQLKFRDTMGLFVIEWADIHDLKMPFGQHVVVGI